jgi:hypothetical protein
MFPGSSTVEWAAVNRLVAGSSPARGANFRLVACLGLVHLANEDLEEPISTCRTHDSLDSGGYDIVQGRGWAKPDCQTRASNIRQRIVYRNQQTNRDCFREHNPYED